MSTDTPQVRWDNLKQRLQNTTLAMQAASSRDLQRKDAVYRQRAILLATSRTNVGSSRSTTPTMVFVLGDHRFGIPLTYVAQVYPACSLTPVPRTPAWVLGIANFESQIRSVIDLAELLEIPVDRPRPVGNILMVRSTRGTIAVRVDRVEEVQKVDFDQLAAPDEHDTTFETRLIRGAMPEGLVILSVEALFARTASPGTVLS